MVSVIVSFDCEFDTILNHLSSSFNWPEDIHVMDKDAHICDGHKCEDFLIGVY